MRADDNTGRKKKQRTSQVSKIPSATSETPEKTEGNFKGAMLGKGKDIGCNEESRSGVPLTLSVAVKLAAPARLRAVQV